MLADVEIEMRRDTSKKIRDRLVGRIYNVTLREEHGHHEGPFRFFKKVSSAMALNKMAVSCNPKKRATKDPDSMLLLTVESVEVYTASEKEKWSHIDDSEQEDGPALHSPPAAVEGHVYSYSVSMSQVLRVAQLESDVTIFFHPNTAVSEDPNDNASSFTCEFSDASEAAEFVKSLEGVLEQFARAILHLSNGYTLPEEFQVLAVSHGPLSDINDPWKAQTSPPQEIVVARAPAWGAHMTAPDSWQPPSSEGKSQTSVWVYLNTPLGPGVAQITEEAVARHLEEGQSSLRVKVATKEQQINPEKPSHTVHRDSSNNQLASRESSQVSVGTACSVASTKSSSNVSPKEAVLHCRLVQPGKKEGNASNTLPTAPSAAADTTADASEAAARSVTVNGGGGADTAGERLQRASRGLSPRSDINELLLAGGADTSVGQGQHEVGEQERDEAGEPSLLASSSRGRRLLSRIRRSAAQLPVRLQGQQHDGRGREGSLELWKMVVLLCAPLMLLSLAEHLLEGSLIPHNCWPARLLTSLLSCAWLGFIALAQQQGWLERCWPQKAAAPAERAVENGVVGGGAKAGETLQIRLVKAEVLEEQWGGKYRVKDAGRVSKQWHVEASTDSELSLTGVSPTASLDAYLGFTRDEVARYMWGYGGNVATARKQMKLTYEWRKETDTFNILDQPQPHFETFKSFFDHGCMGTTRSGRAVWVIKAGQMREGWQKFKATGLTSRDVARHVAFTQDFLYKVIDPAPLPDGGRSIWINDLKGMGMRDIGSKAMDFGLQMMGVVEKHYPEHLGKALVINAPGFFNLLWRIVQPLIPAATKKRLFVIRSIEEVHKTLLEDMDDDHILAEYGGSFNKHLYESEPEIAIRKHAAKVTQQSSAEE